MRKIQNMGRINTHLSTCWRCFSRISLLTNNIIQRAHRSQRHTRKWHCTIFGKIPVDSPRLAEIKGTLNQHCLWPKRLERHDHVSEMKLSLQVEPDADVLLTAHCLPPTIATSTTAKGWHDVFNPVTLLILSLNPGICWVAIGTFGRLFQVTHYTEPFRVSEATSGSSRKCLLSSNEQITSSRVTAALVTLWLVFLGKWTWNTIQSTYNNTNP